MEQQTHSWWICCITFNSCFLVATSKYLKVPPAKQPSRMVARSSKVLVQRAWMHGGQKASSFCHDQQWKHIFTSVSTLQDQVGMGAGRKTIHAINKIIAGCCTSMKLVRLRLQSPSRDPQHLSFMDWRHSATVSFPTWLLVEMNFQLGEEILLLVLQKTQFGGKPEFSWVRTHICGNLFRLDEGA